MNINQKLINSFCEMRIKVRFSGMFHHVLWMAGTNTSQLRRRRQQVRQIRQYMHTEVQGFTFQSTTNFFC
jgi:histidinol-phosphate/aromatic aminotransferase/cobyric acid decarboxylase-like protein